jgi:hypothetical protein
VTQIKLGVVLSSHALPGHWFLRLRGQSWPGLREQLTEGGSAVARRLARQVENRIGKMRREKGEREDTMLTN